MRFPFAFLGLSTQIPLQPNARSHRSSMATQNADFAFKEASDIFSPKDLVSPGVVYGPRLDLNDSQIQLGRPGSAVANAEGDLAFVPYSKYSLEDQK